jgi:enoyl-CoA hydratase
MTEDRLIFLPQNSSIFATQSIGRTADFLSTMSSSTLDVRQVSSTLVVELNRPEKLNALNRAMLDELEQLFSDPVLPARYRAVIITGKGKAFAAGADIAELAGCTQETGTEFSRRGQRVFARIESLPIPVIAAVGGYALGGGCELAMACHLRFAATTAVFGQPEVKLGIIPGYGGTQRLARLIGMARAVEFMLTGEHLSAQRAYELGLVNRVFEPEKLLDETLAFCATLETLPPRAIEAILRTTYGVASARYDVEAEQFGLLCGTDDFREGTSAFLEKRTPSFTGH